MLRPVTCFLLTLLLQSAAVALDVTALATATGNVTVNGKSLEKTSVVFPGDELLTSPKSAVMLYGKGFSLQVGNTTKFSVGRESFLLENGTLHAIGRVKITAGGATILSHSSDANFAVLRSGAMTTVSVATGRVVVFAENKQITMTPGETRTFGENPPEASAKTAPHRKTMLIALLGGASVSAAALIASQIDDMKPHCISNCGVFQIAH